MQAVLTVIPGKEPDLLNAGILGGQMKAQGRIDDCRIAGAPRGLSIILKDNASAQERRAIIDEFKALGYQIIEAP